MTILLARKSLIVKRSITDSTSLGRTKGQQTCAQKIFVCKIQERRCKNCSLLRPRHNLLVAAYRQRKDETKSEMSPKCKVRSSRQYRKLAEMFGNITEKTGDFQENKYHSCGPGRTPSKETMVLVSTTLEQHKGLLAARRQP